MADLLGIGASIVGKGILSGINNALGWNNYSKSAKLNYKYGEMAAQAADARTRALYEDIYAPGAQMRMLKEAGLSPSIYYGGTPGQGGMSGAQGTGATGGQAPFMPISLLEAAQVAQMYAETQKTKAETTNIEAQTKNTERDTEQKKLANEYQRMANKLYSIEFDITTGIVTNEDGTETSLYDYASNFYNYEDYAENVKRIAKNTDYSMYQKLNTEVGNKILRGIYEANNRLQRDIAELSSEEVDAKFQESIIKELQKTNFAELNAEAAIGELKANISTNELTENQKEAWNNLMDKLGKKGSTTRDIIVALCMILGTFTKSIGLKVNVGGKK